MPFMKLRISLDISDNVVFDPSIPAHLDDRQRHFRLIRTMIKDKEIDQATIGFETKNKYGEPCRPHFHCHFYFINPDIIDPKRSITQYLKSRANSQDIKLKGNKKWCLQLVEEPEDHDRFYRYPFKFGAGYDGFANCNLIIGDTLHPTQIKIAVEENKQRIDANCLHREKSREKQTFKDKLFKHLEDMQHKDDYSFQNHQCIWISILEYYKEEGKPINMQTIDGYTTLYQLHIGTLTPLQAYVMRTNGPE